MQNTFGIIKSVASPAASDPADYPLVQAPSKRRFGKKKMFVAAAAIAVIVIIVAAVLITPQGNADVLPLGVHYVAGENLTYDVTTSFSSQSINSSVTTTSKATLGVDVVSFDGQIYTLNYTETSSLGDETVTTSNLVSVQESDMVTFLSVLPVELQEVAAFSDTNSSNPFMMASFNQTQAKVGDTWQIPMNTGNSANLNAENMTVTFAAIQDLTVPAGTYKVFRIDFSANENQGSPLTSSLLLDNIQMQISGQSYLEYGTCKQIESNLQLNMTTHLGNSPGYNEGISFASTLTKDTQPSSG